MSAYVVMGVSGCGKSTVARALAESAGGVYLDADDFHPPANKDKMAAGHPLTDEDRWGWLDALNRELKARAQEKTFLACSALREIYREKLKAGLPDLRFIYLKGSKELIRQRLADRQGHFMPPGLLESQFATLEEPADATVISIDQPPGKIVAAALASIRV